MFLHTLGHGVGNREIQERFQRSDEIVRRHFVRVLKAMMKLSMDIIKPFPNYAEVVPEYIQNKPHYWPCLRSASVLLMEHMLKLQSMLMSKYHLLEGNELTHKMEWHNVILTCVLHLCGQVRKVQHMIHIYL